MEDRAIAESLSALNHRLVDHLLDAGYAVTPESWRSPHMIAARHPHKAAADVAADWKSRNVYVSARGDWLRIAPHLWIDEHDEQCFLTAIKQE
ncbi:hypothetical protein JCM17845_27130 [Iodidimonas gelatinilytica]|uniref:Uncharacterized protein n=2 Tax=Iodidimonas gelatinilytica TaxID=1236966 RepID=A0A5A7N3Z6_9PROT|nr:hypothetical protein [Iodidimonas gelatinilytica]GER02090.1 hypothetical protein JCM17845_27130 [Iodidimonas gelatinilytica]